MDERENFAARFQALYRQSLADIAANMVKWRALVEGRVKAESAAEIADAHYWLGQHYTIDGEIELGIHHSREALTLLDQIHASDDTESRAAYEDWRHTYIRWIERIPDRERERRKLLELRKGATEDGER